MSHRDAVEKAAAGLCGCSGSTDTCPVAAMGDVKRGFYGVQFHPEVVHTTHGKQILANFLFGVCDCRQGLGPQPPDSGARRRNPGGGGRPQRTVLSERRRRFDGRLHAVASGRWAPTASTASTSIPGFMREGETEFVSGVFSVRWPSRASRSNTRARSFSAVSPGSATRSASATSSVRPSSTSRNASSTAATTWTATGSSARERSTRTRSSPAAPSTLTSSRRITTVWRGSSASSPTTASSSR